MSINLIHDNSPRILEALNSVRSGEGGSDERKESTRLRHLREYSEVGNRAFFVARDLKGEAVGYVQLIFMNADNDPELANGKDIAHIHDLLVISKCRRQGYALEIMRTLEDQARLMGLRTLTLGVDSPNLAAMKLYDRLGYSEFKSAEGQNEDERCLYLRKRITN